MPSPLGVAVDLENLRDGVAPVMRLLRRLDGDGAVVYLVGSPWAQDLATDEVVPADWRPARRIVTACAREAADDEIHLLLERWREEGRVAVVASSDGGFADSLVAHRAVGLHAFVVTTGTPAKRLRQVAQVFRLDGAIGVDEAAGVIEAAR